MQVAKITTIKVLSQQDPLSFEGQCNCAELASRAKNHRFIYNVPSVFVCFSLVKYYSFGVFMIIFQACV